MGYTEEELKLLSKMSQGLFDGPIGGVSQYYYGCPYAYSGKYIKDGVPISFIEDYPKQNITEGVIETIPGERHETRMESDDQKLRFLRKNGYFIKDIDAQKYCAKYSDLGKYIDIENSYYEITIEPKTGRQYWSIVFTAKTCSKK